MPTAESAIFSVSQPAPPQRFTNVVLFGNVTLDYASVVDESAIQFLGAPDSNYQVLLYTSTHPSYPGGARIINGGSMDVDCGGTFYLNAYMLVTIGVSIEGSRAVDGGAICARGPVDLGKNAFPFKC